MLYERAMKSSHSNTTSSDSTDTSNGGALRIERKEAIPATNKNRGKEKVRQGERKKIES